MCCRKTCQLFLAKTNAITDLASQAQLMLQREMKAYRHYKELCHKAQQIAAKVRAGT